ncbi:MAG: hypothetical protein WCA08_12215 [Desulfoferrobacter sp.]
MHNFPKLNQIAACRTLFLHEYDGPAHKEAFREAHLRRLVRYSYDNVPYYRRLLDDTGVRPRDIQGIEDLAAVPITHKRRLQSLTADQIIALNVEQSRLITRRTSGSTGVPTLIRRTWFEERLLQSFRRRAMGFLGQRSADRVAFIGRVRSTDPNDHQFLMRIANAFGFYQTFIIDCFLPITEILRQMSMVKADIVTGLSGVLFQLAQTILHKGYDRIAPRFVVTGGEMLTPYMRKQIGEAFGTKVYDVYASHEFNLIAWECKETGEYHTCDDSLIVEVLKDGRKAEVGEQGELVVTSLFSYAMPFIRYRLGDLVIQGLEMCSCGSTFSTIREISGRMIDYLSLSDGRKIHPYEIIRFLVHDKEVWVRQYQLVQHSENRVTLKLVPFGTPDPKKLNEIQVKVSAIFADQADFDVDVVEKIEGDPRGKFMVSRSHVASFYDG